MINKVLFGLIYAFTLVATDAALAAESKSSVSTRRSALDRSLEQVYLDFGSAYHGSTLNRFDTHPLNSRGKKDVSSFTSIDHEANLAYLYDRQAEESIGIDLQFTTPSAVPNKQFELGDVGLRWFRHNTIATDSLILSTDVTIQAPTSEGSRADHMRWAFDTTPFVIYNVPGTRWRLGVWTEFRYRDGVDHGYRSRLYGAPYVVYKVSDKFWLQLLAEGRADHDLDTPTLAFHNSRTDIQPGIVWRPSPTLKITPFLQIFPSNPLAADQVAVGCSLYARLL